MIPVFEVNEAAKIVKFVAVELVAMLKEKTGRQGADLRRLCGDLEARAEDYIVANVVGKRLQECFTQARMTGAVMMDFNELRRALIEIPAGMGDWTHDTYYCLGRIIEDQNDRIAYRCRIAHASADSGSFEEDRAAHPDNWGHALSPLAVLLRNACVDFCLQQISMVLLEVNFTSRDDVDRVRSELHPAFFRSAEVATDEMVLDVYRKVISLHAAVTLYLYETARPLPQMLNFEFNVTRPTLVQSYRLYATASRADQIRQENKVVHPAFPPRLGRALAF